MNAITPRRSIAKLLSISPLSLYSLPAARRYESTARRTTKRLRVKPDETFTSSIPPEKVNDHIVFNPPSAPLSAYHTPAAFLPRDDPRRQLLAESHQHANPYNNPDNPLPPPVRRGYVKKYHLGEKEIEEIRRLRTEDPYTWTRKTLAEKFDCSQFFVGMVVQASQKRMDEQRAKLEYVKSKWGWRKRFAREDRAKRRELWGRDE